MNNGIKEILDDLKKHNVLSASQDSYLLDHITNLQTIEQQYSAILSENAELENKITNLQEEYEKEHYLVDKLTRQLNDEYKNTEYQCKQKEVYKSRNEKANKFIDEEPLFEDPFGEGEHTFLGDANVKYNKKLKSILNGGDDNGN